MSQALDAGYPRDQFQTDAAFSPYRGEQWFSDLLLAPGR
jgi:hypothetical protein